MPFLQLGFSLSPQETLQQYSDRVALRLAVPSGFLIACAILLANQERSIVPLVGDWQAFGRILVILLAALSLVTGGIAYVLGVRARNSRVAANRCLSWQWGVVPIVFAYGLLITIIAIAGVQIAALGFRQLALYKLQGAILAGAAGAGLLHWMIRRLMIISVSSLLQVMLVIVAGGIYLTMARVEDPLWWYESFSVLGTLQSNTALIFNATLIFAGIMFLVWLPYLLSDMQVLEDHQVMTPRGVQLFLVAFTLLGCAFLLIGAFPYGATAISSWIHNLAAYSAGTILMLLMVTLRWLLPGLTRELFATSWLLAAGIFISVGAAAAGYFNIVGLELLCFTLGMAWLQIFVHNVHTHAAELEPATFPA